MANPSNVAYGHPMPGDPDTGQQPADEPRLPEADEGRDVDEGREVDEASDPFTGERLPSRPSGGVMVAGIFATLDRVLMNRPRPVTEISEQYHDPWATKDGISVDGLEDSPERPEPPDRSGARL